VSNEESSVWTPPPVHVASLRNRDDSPDTRASMQFLLNLAWDAELEQNLTPKELVCSDAAY